jgi:hypothetical protein
MSDIQQRKLLPGPIVDERYGICARTRARWKRDPKLNFPQPAVVIKGREYYDENHLLVFERANAGRIAAA